MGSGAILTYQNPDFKVKILGPQMVETIDRHEMWTHSIVGIKPLASSAIMTNNMSVGFTTFAFGITAGLGTIYMMAFNGLLIGVIGMACALSGMSLQLWSFVAPHGVLELPAIFIAGGAGLRIAQGLLFPGVLPRRESLARAGLEAVQLVLGTIPILIIAGLIEAFVSPTGLPVVVEVLHGGSVVCASGGLLVRVSQRSQASSELIPFLDLQIRVHKRWRNCSGIHFQRQRPPFPQTSQQQFAAVNHLLRGGHLIHFSFALWSLCCQLAQVRLTDDCKQNQMFRHHHRRRFDDFGSHRGLGEIGEPYDEAAPFLVCQKTTCHVQVVGLGDFLVYQRKLFDELTQVRAAFSGGKLLTNRTAVGHESHAVSGVQRHLGQSSVRS